MNEQPWASVGRFGCGYGPLQAHRAANVWAMVSRLAVSTPQPTHLPKPSSPLSRQRLRYSRRFMTLIRPSIPARNRDSTLGVIASKRENCTVADLRGVRIQYTQVM